MEHINANEDCSLIFDASNINSEELCNSEAHEFITLTHISDNVAIPTNSKENNLRQLICERFGFDDIIYKRIVGKHDFYFTKSSNVIYSDCEFNHSFYYPIPVDHGLDIQSLLVATEDDLRDLFPVPMLGTRAKFRFHLNLWRKDVRYSYIYSDSKSVVLYVYIFTSCRPM